MKPLFRVDDRWAMHVGGAVRTLSGTVVPALKVGDSIGGVGQDLSRTRVLEALGVAEFCVRHTNGFFGALVEAPGGDNLSPLV